MDKVKDKVIPNRYSSNDSLRQNLTKEMMEEVAETFACACEPGCEMMPLSKIPIALKALGMSIIEVDDERLLRAEEKEIDLDRFVEIVLSCTKHANWAANEMGESYGLFDKDNTGNIGPKELRVVFARIGENLLEREVEDQLREFDIDGDLMVSALFYCKLVSDAVQMAVSEYYKMVTTTRGTEFLFDDSLF